MELKVKEQNGLMLIEVQEDRIDAACAIQFKDHMRDLVARGADLVMLDLSQVNFLDSSGLGAVVAVMKLLKPSQRLELAGLTPTVEKVFRLTRMDSVFTIHPSVPEAIRDAG